ncbi:MAG: D-TA family PLP-dependent enzyme [Planctomycetes bacterium]|nr:D-TA family PLP-dependent enzyme [Planctomycetota bacterium]
MNPAYTIRNIDTVFSPALVFFKDLIRNNIAEIIRIAGSTAKLRPHVKTHKTREIAKLEIAAGITKHKCATLAEAEMLAQAGAVDVLIAYPIVGPNCRRLALLMKKYPQTRFSALVDYPAALTALGKAMTDSALTLDVLIDLDVGQHRTGIPCGPAAISLYEQIAKTPGTRPDGFHVYDGHNHQEPIEERQAAVDALLIPVLEMRKKLEAKGIPVPRLVCGGTPTFTIWAKKDFPGLECSPGTFVLFDHGYGSKFTDLKGLVPAAVLVTRVISRPSSTRITFDLGYKAVASDPPAGKRVILLDVPEYTAILQNEEHLVVETPQADKFAPGDVVFAIPAHICPTCAMHQRAYVVENGEVTTTWDIAGRDRVLSV